VDTKTRHALKQDRFVDATASGLDWLQDHRRNAIIAVIAVVVIAAAVIAGVVVYNSRLSKAEALFGQAMDIYNTPLAQPGQEIAPGQKTYATAAARAKAANPLFVQVADHYDWFKVGKNAQYFAGLTYLDMGQTATAEKELDEAIHSGDSGLEALAKMALAGLYRQTGRDDQAVALYKQVIKHPTVTVPAAAAQLELAGLYETTNPAEAKKIYAQVKDQNKNSIAGQIAAQKLGGGK
jgi:predicted negative regulator of RcsB-dependent stress response